MGVFQTRPSQIWADRAVRDGANARIVQYVDDAYIAREKKEKVQSDIEKMEANKLELAWLNTAWKTLYTDPQVLRVHKEHIFHVHAKFRQAGLPGLVGTSFRDPPCRARSFECCRVRGGIGPRDRPREILFCTAV